jgi:two-component system OmpR family response regulator
MTRPGERASILVVEDDEDLRFVLTDNLDAEGYRVVEASTVRAARRELERGSFALVILDLMLPDGDGYTLCRELRQNHRQERVLMLTARTLEDDVVHGFEAGADDYVLKPYRLRELLARVKALVARRRDEAAPRRLTLPGFELDMEARTLYCERGPIALTRTEFDVLSALLKHKGVALARDQLIDEAWGRDVVVDPRTVDNFVASLRKKLGWQPDHPWRLVTVRGIGYRLEVEEADGP